MSCSSWVETTTSFRIAFVAAKGSFSKKQEPSSTALSFEFNRNVFITPVLSKIQLHVSLNRPRFKDEDMQQIKVLQRPLRA
jgi:hypothetical protein